MGNTRPGKNFVQKKPKERRKERKDEKSERKDGGRDKTAKTICKRVARGGGEKALRERVQDGKEEPQKNRENNQDSPPQRGAEDQERRKNENEM